MMAHQYQKRSLSCSQRQWKYRYKTSKINLWLVIMSNYSAVHRKKMLLDYIPEHESVWIWFALFIVKTHWSINPSLTLQIKSECPLWSGHGI